MRECQRRRRYRGGCHLPSLASILAKREIRPEPDTRTARCPTRPPTTMPCMDVAQAQRDKFDDIVAGCHKDHLQLTVRVLQCDPIGMHIAVKSAVFAAVYQLGRSWPASFVQDLQAGAFG